MDREYLRKVKFIARHEYEWDKGELLSTKSIYEEGYFHRWVVEYKGNLHEGFSTHIYALVEDQKGKAHMIITDNLTFID